MDLDQLKLKTSEQLNDEEKGFIKQNIDKLNDEDKDAYKDFLEIPEPHKEEAIEGGQDNQGQKEPERITDNQSNSGESGEKKQFVFNSEEEAREWVKKQQEENEKQKQAAINAATTQAEKKYVEENWRPENWNTAMKKAVEFAKQEIKEDLEVQKQKEVGEKLQKEWEELTVEKKLPSLKTVKGKTIHDNIIKFGVAANKQTFHEAYDVWAQIPESIGGGLKADAKQENTDNKKEPLSKQKDVASKIGGANSGSKQGADKGIPYDKLHKAKTVEQLLKQEGYI